MAARVMADSKPRSLSSPPTVAQEGECPICYVDFALDELEKGTLQGKEPPQNRRVLVACGHEFCRACLKQHCVHSIQEKTIPIPCPFFRGGDDVIQCPQFLEDAEVQELVCLQDSNHDWREKDDPGPSRHYWWIQYQRLVRMKKDPSLVPCPHCDYLLHPQDTRMKKKKRTRENEQHKNNIACSDCGNGFCLRHGIRHLNVTCPDCRMEFCLRHGISHVGMTCAQYHESEHGLQEALSQSTIHSCSKPCSRCHVPIEKTGGCDHIVCRACKNDFCYKCGTHLYLTGDVVRHCSQCQQSYLDHRQMGKIRLITCLQIPLWLPGIVFYTIGAIVMCIGTCCFCMCFSCGSWLQDQESSSNNNGAKGNTKQTWAPIRGVRLALGLLFVPLIDLLDRCGCGCCNVLLSDLPYQQTEPDDSPV